MTITIDWASTVATLFVTIDPIGLAPLFVAVTHGLSDRERRIIAIRAVVIATLILWASALGGQPVLDLLGITLPAFQIAGGLMLLWIAFEMVFEKRTARKETTARSAVEEDHYKDLAAFPLAVPLMAGPGAITATILIGGEATSRLDTTVMLFGIIGGVMAICFVVFLLASRIDRVLGSTGRIVLTRLLGVILAALAIQFVADGVRALALQ